MIWKKKLHQTNEKIFIQILFIVFFFSHYFLFIFSVDLEISMRVWWLFFSSFKSMTKKISNMHHFDRISETFETSSYFSTCILNTTTNSTLRFIQCFTTSYWNQISTISYHWNYFNITFRRIIISLLLSDHLIQKKLQFNKCSLNS